ncbi:Winged helix-turn helix [Nitrosomonas ureae]|uniref:Winged helix-turn helix n=1 Tax=Nitrosomonas ureae TaxID=44577 RepID=A0A286AGI5_9PROT|nr:Winged helix-turn helix [Nitrosomonas ureae]
MSSVQHNVIRHKIGLLNLAAELGNVSRACKVMGFSRDTFYRYQAAVETGGVDALIDANRRKPSNIKNHIKEATEAAVTAFALEQPAFSQVRVSNELRKRGIFVSPFGVRSVWLRQNLEPFKKRLSALEKHIAETGVVLTEAQVQALEKKQEDDVAHGKIETAHPGYLGSQDIFYVGTIKSVGRIYQQTFVDTYSKWAATKLYTTKTPITAADLLNKPGSYRSSPSRAWGHPHPWYRILWQAGESQLPALSGTERSSITWHFSARFTSPLRSYNMIWMNG